MKKSKLIMLILLTFVMILCFASCRDKEDNTTTTTDPAGNTINYDGTPAQIINNYFCNCTCCNNNSTQSSNNNSSNSSTQNANNTLTGPSANEANPVGKVLYHDNYIKITLKGYGEGLMGPTVKLEIENQSTSSVTIMCNDSSVDGYSVEASLWAEVGVGKKAIDEITIWSSDLEDSGITDPNTLEFRFSFYATDSYGSWESDVITIVLD